MTRTERIKDEYRDPGSNPHGCSRDQKYLDQWAERAHTNSDSYKHRAKGGEMELPDTNAKAGTSGGHFEGDARKVAKQLNHDVEGGSRFMPRARRDE